MKGFFQFLFGIAITYIGMGLLGFEGYVLLCLAIVVGAAIVALIKRAFRPDRGPYYSPSSGEDSDMAPGDRMEGGPGRR